MISNNKLAEFGAAAIECIHGYDCCPICDAVKETKMTQEQRKRLEDDFTEQEIADIQRRIKWHIDHKCTRSLLPVNDWVVSITGQGDIALFKKECDL